ncbi:MAG TPA: FHA domain-containing protein [Planctomycetota bacterium]|nr:FHA domain-containing protein [Planctomycetota bacterium]
MSETVVQEAAPLPKTHLLELLEKLTGEKPESAQRGGPSPSAPAPLPPALEKALQHLHDDEYERLTRDEQRGFFGDVVKKELARQGLAKGQLAMSGLGSNGPVAVALAQLGQQDPKAGAIVAASLARLRSVAIDCVACESLVLPRFKSEDDRCRTCGELLPVAATFGQKEDAAHVAASLEEPVAAEEGPAIAPETAAPAWEVVVAKPDVTRFLVLSKENLDWDDVIAQKKKAEDEVRVARERVEAETRRKAEEAARAKAEAEAKAKAEAEAAARKKVEEEEARKRAAEEARKKVEAEAAARKKAAEDAAKKAAEEVAARKRAEEELRRKQEEEVAAKKREEEAAKAKAEEDERRKKLEQSRPYIGCLTGINAGQVIRINDLDPTMKPSGKRPLVVMTGGKAKILVPSTTKAWINDKPVAGGIFELAPGNVVRGIFEDDDLALIDEMGELQGVNADPVHFERADEEGGGPWNYWNEPVKIGSGSGCEICLNDDGVDEAHALVATRFGRVVVEDTCKTEDGLWIGTERVRSLLADPGVKFRLGSKGPSLQVVAGQVEVKEAAAAAGPMKPARYVRTCLHIQTTRGEQQKIFLFARREVRFGRMFSRDEVKVENDLVIAPADDLQTMADKQGSFSLTREGVTVRLDDRKNPMSVNDEELKPGQTVLLKREFTIEIGVGIVLHGQVYRAPTTAKRPDGPAQLGIEGGHPNECVKMVREGDDSGHTYVFLVRQIRLGSGQTDSIQLPGIGVAPGHATIQLSRGVLQIIAPRDKNKVKVDGQVLKAGVPHPLKLGAKILLGECLIRFEVVTEADFKIQAAAVS